MDTKRLRSLVEYDPETGVFRWKAPNKGKAKVGQIINGWNAGKGYKMVGLDFGRYYLHRLAWQYVHGREPLDQIDHINRNVTDNRICNLREANAAQNGWNQLRNRAGFKGVYLERRTGKFFAAICCNRVKHHLGTFDTPEAAHHAYEAAAQKYFGEFARAR